MGTRCNIRCNVELIACIIPTDFMYYILVTYGYEEEKWGHFSEGIFNRWSGTEAQLSSVQSELRIQINSEVRSRVQKFPAWPAF